MKKVATAVACVALLAGCSSPAVPAATTPEKERNQASNEEACQRFSEATEHMFSATTEDGAMREAVWSEGLVAIVDAHGKASGAVRQNLWNIADSWRPLYEVTAMEENLYVFNDRLDLVANSCGAEGIEITYTSFGLP